MDIDELLERWEQVFGTELAWGFVITERQLPLIERCLAARDSTELDEYVATAVASGKTY